MSKEENQFDNNLGKIIKGHVDLQTIRVRNDKFHEAQVQNEQETKKLRQKMIEEIDQRDFILLAMIEEAKKNQLDKKKMEERVAFLKTQIEKNQEDRNQKISVMEENFYNKREENKMTTQNLIEKIEQAQEFIDNRYQMENEFQELQEQLDFQHSENKRVGTILQEQKNKSIGDIKKNMLKQIQQTKKSLLSQKKEEFQTHTRMTMLQNEVLQNELQFQSQMTEEIMVKNYTLNEEVKQLKQELYFHEQIKKQFQKKALNELTMKDFMEPVKKEDGQLKKKNQNRNLDKNYDKQQDRVQESTYEKIENCSTQEFAKLKRELVQLKKNEMFLQNDLNIQKNLVNKNKQLAMQLIQKIQEKFDSSGPSIQHLIEVVRPQLNVIHFLFQLIIVKSFGEFERKRRH